MTFDSSWCCCLSFCSMKSWKITEKNSEPKSWGIGHFRAGRFHRNLHILHRLCRHRCCYLGNLLSLKCDGLRGVDTTRWQMFHQILPKDQASPRIPIIGILLPVPSGIRFRAPMRLQWARARHSNMESSWAQHSSQHIYIYICYVYNT